MFAFVRQTLSAGAEVLSTRATPRPAPSARRYDCSEVRGQDVVCRDALGAWYMMRRQVPSPSALASVCARWKFWGSPRALLEIVTLVPLLPKI